MGTRLKVHGREVAKVRATRFPPPMWGRDREGGGDGAPRANLPSARNFQKSGVLERAFVRHRIGNNRCARCTPPPCPSPTWGEGTLWHRSSTLLTLHSRSCQNMCACAGACAGTTVERPCSKSPFRYSRFLLWLQSTPPFGIAS